MQHCHQRPLSVSTHKHSLSSISSSCPSSSLLVALISCCLSFSSVHTSMVGAKAAFQLVPSPALSLPHSTHHTLTTHNMKQLSPELKQHILTQHRAGTGTQSLAALARSAGVGVSASTVLRWQRRWDGTVQSLQHRGGAGRPRLLSATQVRRHVTPRVRAANRRGAAMHYTTMLHSIRAATGKSPSLRTMQRYGKQEQVKQKRGKKRTAKEC